MATNRRVIYRSAGGPAVLELIEEAVPEPGPGEVCVKVEAAGLAFADIVQRNGLYPGQPGFPMTPGYDLCGRVEALGREASRRFRKGDRVAGVTVFGAYADYVIVPVEHLVAVPEGPDAAKIVALCLNYVTACQMLHRFAAVEPGDRILVHAAGGGVGTALLELGGLYDLTMYGTVSRRKAEIVERFGANPIDYKRRNFVKEVRRLSDGAGVMAAFDAVGGRHARRTLKTLNQNGRLVLYGSMGGFPKGRRSTLRLGADLLSASTSLFTLFLRAQAVLGYNIDTLRQARPGWYREDLINLVHHLEAGRLDPVIADRFPLDKAAEAQKAFIAAAKPGKLVLEAAGAGDRPKIRVPAGRSEPEEPVQA